MTRITQTLIELKNEFTRRYDYGPLDAPLPLGRYYIRLTDIVHREAQTLNDGVPISQYHRTGEIYQNPVTISFYGLDIWAQYLNSGSVACLRQFLKIADWLVNHNQAGAWLYSIAIPKYTTQGGWKSAMAQGLAISVLCRAYAQTKAAQYLDLACKSAAVASRPIARGGCSSFDTDGLPFLEEAAVEPAAHILNGAIFALWGFYDLDHLTDAFSPFLCKAAMRLAKEIPSFDLRFWSTYDQIHRVPARRGYHMLHIAQMKVQHRLTGMPVFGQYANRWTYDLRNPTHAARAFAAKAWSAFSEAYRPWLLP